MEWKHVGTEEKESQEPRLGIPEMALDLACMDGLAVSLNLFVAKWVYKGSCFLDRIWEVE